MANFKQQKFKNKQELLGYVGEVNYDITVIVIFSNDNYYIDTPDAFIRSWETILYKGKLKNITKNNL